MSQYDFSTLNDKDLEILVRDLLTKELAIPFQSFKTGKDGGIDLRYSTNTSENEIIVQSKHYLKSGFTKLLYVLKNQEKDKIEKLQPQRYILVTSIGLSPLNKQQIRETLEPYILNTNDIYGADDLNGLLSKHENIEQKHFKLWFSNTHVISKIIHNGIHGRSAFIRDKIKKNIGLYVINQSYDKAIDILKEHKILLITGTPGIGKTSLANLITYQLLSQDFQLIYVDEKIREAEDLFDSDFNSKQLFYFDDFLGSNYLEIINPKNTDRSIVHFIERIQSSKNKYLILTTRSTILNQAASIHEKLSRANLDSLKFELKIENYSDYDKAQILYNHLYFNDVDNEKIKEVFANGNYWRIIQHSNYNPRLIEFFTKEHNIKHLQANGYIDFILFHLNNPNAIWKLALENQLNDSERFLLFTLSTFGKVVSIKDLEKGYEARINYEVTENGFIRGTNIFKNALQNLMDGYITNTIVFYSRENKFIDFINPSLKDYLISFFNENSSEKWRLIKSFIYIEQFINVFKNEKEAKNNIIIKNQEIQMFIEIACSKDLLSISFYDKNKIHIRLTNLLFSYINNQNYLYVDQKILSVLKMIDWKSFNDIYLSDFLPVIEGINHSSTVYSFFENNWDLIITKLIKSVKYDTELEHIKGLFDKYNLEYKTYKQDDSEWINSLEQTVHKVFKNEADDIFELNEREIFSKDDYVVIEEQITDKFNTLSEQYFINDEIRQEYSPFDNVDLDSLIEENNMIDTKEELDTNSWTQRRDEFERSRELIDNLFSIMEK